MITRFRFMDGLALGLLGGFVVSTVSLWLLGSTNEVVRQYSAQHLTHFFTLVAGALALWGVSRQIQSNFELAERTRIARLDAALSSLPIVLSNIVQMCRGRYRAISRGRKTAPSGNKWEISEFELSTLKSCIEYSTGAEKEMMQKIIRLYQILISRWKDEEAVDLFQEPIREDRDPKLTGLQKQYYAILNWITLMQMTNSLFPFARGRVDPIDKDKVRGSILSELESIADDEIDGDVGWLLINNRNFGDFVDRRKREDAVPFLDNDWI